MAQALVDDKCTPRSVSSVCQNLGGTCGLMVSCMMIWGRLSSFLLLAIQWDGRVDDIAPLLETRLVMCVRRTHHRIALNIVTFASSLANFTANHGHFATSLDDTQVSDGTDLTARCCTRIRSVWISVSMYSGLAMASPKLSFAYSLTDSV